MQRFVLPALLFHEPSIKQGKINPMALAFIQAHDNRLAGSDEMDLTDNTCH